jgi:hypothetical protein
MAFDRGQMDELGVGELEVTAHLTGYIIEHYHITIITR